MRSIILTYSRVSIGFYLTVISRDFNHRVKSISMASFKPEEIEKLKKGGNNAARDVWMASWTPAEHPLPDSQNPRAVKDFMQKKYVEKRWTARQKVQPAPSFAEYPKKPASRVRDLLAVFPSSVHSLPTGASARAFDKYSRSQHSASQYRAFFPSAFFHTSTCTGTSTGTSKTRCCTYLSFVDPWWSLTI